MAVPQHRFVFPTREAVLPATGLGRPPRGAAAARLDPASAPGGKSGFQFDLQEHDLACRLVEHVVLDAGFAEIGFADPELRLGAFPFGATMVISPEVTGTIT